MKQRLFIALSAYAVIALVAWWVFPEKELRYVVVGLMALLAFKSYLHRSDTMRGAAGKRAESEGRE